MQLIGNLYDIVFKEKKGEDFQFTVKLNSDCFIYKAHFPDFPITPGVCVMQMARELCSEAIGEKLLLSHAGNVKFLRAIIPTEMPVLDVYIAKISRVESMLSAQIAIGDKNGTAAKLSLTFMME